MAKSAVSKMAAAAALLLVLVAVPVAVAETYQVGDDSGWTQGIDYTTWTRGKTFRVGDTLEFKYGASHTVDVVNKDGYDKCDGSGAQTFSGGDTKIPLNSTGPMYVICAQPGHCQGGMKLTITVQGSSAPDTPSTPRSPSPPSSTPGNPSPPSSTPGSQSPPSSSGSPPASETTPPPPPPNAASQGPKSYAMMGVSVVLGVGAWIMG